MSLFDFNFIYPVQRNKNITSIVLRFTIITAIKWSGKVNRDYIVYCLEVGKKFNPWNC